jgi:hypothetical protein
MEVIKNAGIICVLKCLELGLIYVRMTQNAPPYSPRFVLPGPVAVMEFAAIPMEQLVM